MSHVALIAGVVITGSIVGVAAPQHQPPDPVKWALEIPAGRSIRRGETLQVRLTLTLEPDWYIYALSQGPGGPIPMSVSLPAGSAFGLSGKIEEPEPLVGFDSTFNVKTRTHGGRATFSFTLPVRVKSDAPPGPNALSVEVEYQACTKTLCLRPATAVVTLPVEIA
jgi:hypothetical protein